MKVHSEYRTMKKAIPDRFSALGNFLTISAGEITRGLCCRLILSFFIYHIGSAISATTTDTSPSLPQQTTTRNDETDLASENTPLYIGRSLADASTQSQIKSLLKQSNGVLHVASIADLTALPSSAFLDKLIYVDGRSSANDGGQGYFFAEKINSANQLKVDNLLVFKSADRDYYLIRIHDGQINIKSGGATGNGSADDAAAIQAVLDTGVNVIGDSTNDVYLVGLSKKLVAPYRTALIIHSGQRLNLNGATLRIKPGCNCSAIMNEALIKSGPPDTGISILGGVIDGNVQSQHITNIDDQKTQFSPTLYLGNITSSKLQTLKVINYYSSGIYFIQPAGQKNLDNSLNDIVVDTGKGTGIALNGDAFSGNNLQILNTEAFMSGNNEVYYWGAHPNSMTFTGNNSTFGDIYYKNCIRGLKIQDGSTNIAIRKVTADGVVDEFGLKIQGNKIDDKTIHYNDKIMIDTVVAQNNNFSGLYIIWSKGVQIKSYIGTNNGKGYLKKLDPQYMNPANFNDIYILWANANIEKISSTKARAGVIDSRGWITDGDNYRHFGEISVSDQQEGAVASFRDSKNVIDSISINGTGHLSRPIINVISETMSSGENTTQVGTITSNQSMATGTDAVQITGHHTNGMLSIRQARLGNSPSFNINSNSR